jgi:sugar transferase EpsL
MKASPNAPRCTEPWIDQPLAGSQDPLSPDQTQLPLSELRSPLVQTLASRRRRWHRGLVIKHLVDRGLAAIALLLLSPVILGVAVGVALFLGRPVLFTQLRPGLNGRVFKFYKFRTMTDQRDRHGNLLPDAQRLTPFGLLLRNTSLDELPQLLNVLKGDMSIIGPRPLLVSYLERYSPQQARRHEMLPGITGLAQVNGRNTISWDEKFRLDVWYVDHWSLWQDLKILGKTVLKVVKQDGIHQEGFATCEEFKGRNA